MRRRGTSTLFAVLLVLLLAACDPGTTPAELTDFEKVEITEVVDGDTVHALMPSGETERVRLIGIDTPEDTTEIELFGGEATEYARNALDGRHVYLETDVELRDAHGRLLAYVWLDVPGADSEADLRGLLFNAHLLLDGYAQLLTVPPNTRYEESFRVFQTEARDAGRGLWGLVQTEDVLFWADAGDHVGEVVTIEGPVAGTYYSDDTTAAPTFINIGRDHPDPSRVTVFISSSDRDAWPVAPEELYAGETIRVTGQVEIYEGTVEIVVTGPGAIEVVE